MIHEARRIVVGVAGVAHGVCGYEDVAGYWFYTYSSGSAYFVNRV